MPRHEEVRILPYTPEQLFSLVADIESYPLFLPWCVEAKIRSRSLNRVIADLGIGYRFFKEHFTSDVLLTPLHRIDVRYSDGPFRYLENHWIFKDVTPDVSLVKRCQLEFFVDFQFKSQLLQNFIEVLFTEAVHKMVDAFEKRAKVLYGL